MVAVLRCILPLVSSFRLKAQATNVGRILDYTDKRDDNRKACSLHLSLMDRMGVKVDRFGNDTARGSVDSSLPEVFDQHYLGAAVRSLCVDN